MACEFCRGGGGPPYRDVHICYAWTCPKCGDEVWLFRGDRGPDREARASQVEVEAALRGNVGPLLPRAIEAVRFGGQAGDRNVGLFLAAYQPDLSLWQAELSQPAPEGDAWAIDLLRRSVKVLADERSASLPQVPAWKPEVALDGVPGTGDGAPERADARAVGNALFIHAVGPLYAWKRSEKPVVRWSGGRACEPLIANLWKAIENRRVTLLEATADGSVRTWDTFDAGEVHLDADLVEDERVVVRWHFEPWLQVGKQTWHQERGRTDVWTRTGERLARIEGWGGRLVPGGPDGGFWSLDEADDDGSRVPVTLRDKALRVVARSSERTLDPREEVIAVDIDRDGFVVTWMWSGSRRERWTFENGRLVRQDLAEADRDTHQSDKVLQRGWLYREGRGTAFRPHSGAGWQWPGCWKFADPPSGLVLLADGDRFVAVDSVSGARSPEIVVPGAPERIAARADGRRVWLAQGPWLRRLDVDDPTTEPIPAMALPWPLAGLTGPWNSRLVGTSIDDRLRHVVVDLTGSTPRVEGVVEGVLCADGGPNWGPVFVGASCWRVGRWPT